MDPEADEVPITSVEVLPITMPIWRYLEVTAAAVCGSAAAGYLVAPGGGGGKRGSRCRAQERALRFEIGTMQQRSVYELVIECRGTSGPTSP